MQKIGEKKFKIFELALCTFFDPKNELFGPSTKKLEILVNCHYAQYLPSIGLYLHTKNWRKKI